MSKIPFFKNLSTSASQNASVSPDQSQIITDPLALPIDYNQASHYTGGFLSLPPLAIPPNPMLPRVSHIHLAFESLPIDSPDIYSLATLQTLLGGGGSFSAGGPGKGMYSRLYTNVLNQYGWVENCMAFNHAYTDSGLFGISAACATQYVPRMLDTMARELSLLSTEFFSGFGNPDVDKGNSRSSSSSSSKTATISSKSLPRILTAMIQNHLIIISDNEDEDGCSVRLLILVFADIEEPFSPPTMRAWKPLMVDL